MGNSLSISPTDKIYVAGHNGLAGSAVWRACESRGYKNLVGVRSAQVDLRDRDAAHAYIGKEQPDVVVLTAARVGGILANRDYPVQFISDNLRIQDNVLEACHAAGVRRLLFMGSSCIYPKFASQPISEDSLMTGLLEPTNSAYAVAKIAGIESVQAYRRQYGCDWISAMPTNLYGPGDNYDLNNSHVLPALLRKFHEAKERGDEAVTVWGSGKPRREFLHADDLGEACVHLLEHYSHESPINVGTGEDVAIADLARTIADVVGFTGDVVFDTSKPDGTPRKLLDVSRINALGWKSRVPLAKGVEATYACYAEIVSGRPLEAGL